MSATLAQELPTGCNPFESEDVVLNDAARALDRVAFESDEARRAVARLLDGYREGLGVRLELRKTRDRLIQAERSASLGVLVAGVAHDVSTSVGITLTAASHLAERTDGVRRAAREGRMRRSDFDDYLQVATEASDLMVANARRAAELIQGFKRVAVDQTTLDWRRFDLRLTIEEVMISLGPRLRQAGHRVALECPEHIEIDGYPGAISQILTNLVMNSIRHAYRSGETGTLLIRVIETASDHLELYYADDGRGIPVEHRDRVFEPFFTTRRSDGGSGLGLHIVSSIVTDTLKGTISLVSPDKGAGFRIGFRRDAGRVGE